VKSSKTYPAFIFRQRPGSPIQVAFVAPSSEIDSWARVPTKRTGNIRNFQRAELPAHIKEVATFFKDERNASPTSVVVGFDPIRAKEAIKVEAEDGPLASAKIEPGAPVSGKIVIEWPVDPDAQTSAERIERIVAWRPQLEAYIFDELRDITGLDTAKIKTLAVRLATGIRSGELRGFDVEDDATESEHSSEETENDSIDNEVEGVGIDDLPDDIRAALNGQSPGERQVILGRLWFLGQLQEDLLKPLSEDRLTVLYREVYDELKPGILIDGQHRVMGTKTIGNVPFLVTALPGADWPELAFQFIVTNRTAKRVPESLLISIVGNSLSKQQRDDIDNRLRDANIRVGLIEAVMMVHEDEQSPFYGMLAFGLKNEAGFLDAAAMRGKVIKLWYERQPPVRELFDHFCQGRLLAERTDYWKSEQLWFEFFITFWSVVKDRYQGSDVFSSELRDKRLKTPASRLMTATVLMIFQDTLLKSLLKYLQEKATTDKVPIAEALPNADAFGKLVTNRLERLTPEFFQGWQLTGFDGSRGVREDLAEAILLVVSGALTVPKLKEGKNLHRLFKESGR
jgi:hypothetical protein